MKIRTSQQNLCLLNKCKEILIKENTSDSDIRLFEHKFNSFVKCRMPTVYPEQCEKNKKKLIEVAILSSFNTYIKLKIKIDHEHFNTCSELSYKEIKNMMSKIFTAEYKQSYYYMNYKVANILSKYYIYKFNEVQNLLEKYQTNSKVQGRWIQQKINEEIQKLNTIPQQIIKYSTEESYYRLLSMQKLQSYDDQHRYAFMVALSRSEGNQDTIKKTLNRILNYNLKKKNSLLDSKKHFPYEQDVI